MTQAAPNRVPTCPILSKIANFSFGLRGPRGLPQYLGPEDSKPKIDLKSFETIKKEAYMPILSSLSQKTKKLGLNMLARRFRRWTFQTELSSCNLHCESRCTVRKLLTRQDDKIGQQYQAAVFQKPCDLRAPVFARFVQLSQKL